MTKTTKLFWTLVALGLFLEARAVDAAQAPDNAVAPETVYEISEDCKEDNEASGFGGFISKLNIPFSGLVTGAFDNSNSAKKVNKALDRHHDCIESSVKEVSKEVEREAERKNRILNDNCQNEIFRCGSDDNRRACGELWNVDNVCPQASVVVPVAPEVRTKTTPATNRTPVKPDEDAQEVASTVPFATEDPNHPCKALRNGAKCPENVRHPYRCQQGQLIRDDQMECEWLCAKGCNWVPVA